MTTAATIVPPYFENGTLEHVRLNMKNRKHLAQSLLKARIERQTFDPTNSEHRAAYLIFMRSGKWVMHFYNEWPHQSVVSMAQTKLITHFLSNSITEKAAEKLLAKFNLAVPKPIETVKVAPKPFTDHLDDLVDMVKLSRVA